ncbi:hypothetical protein HHI36_021650 [Cryptolaemus montrouzieri]|uniref:Uncharacterized protein n=1 Tax=Cryptolaemus montrouzieri TaxID=559131 RepID=A0ABD2MYD6_9CUCU
MSLPRPSRNPEVQEEIHEEYRPEPPFNRYQEPMSPKLSKADPRTRKDKYRHEERSAEHEIAKYLEKPIAKYTDNKYLERQKSLEREKQYQKVSDRQISNGHRSLEKQNSRNKSYDYDGPKYYFNEFENKAENGEYAEKRYHDDKIRRMEKDKSNKYFEDDGFDESLRYRNSSNADKSRHSSYEPEDYHKEPPRSYHSPPVPKMRQKYVEDYTSGEKYEKPQFIEDFHRDVDMRVRTRRDLEEYRTEPEMATRVKKNSEEYQRQIDVRTRSKNNQEEFSRDSDIKPRTRKIIEEYEDEVDTRVRAKPSPDKYQKDHRYFGEEPRPRPKSVNELERQRYPREKEEYRQSEFFDDSKANRRKAQLRQRSPSPEIAKVSPQDRFKDAKEKFLSMERERLANQRKGNREEHVGNGQNMKVPFLKRHESMMSPMKERYEDNFYNDRSEVLPKPTPRLAEEVKYRKESPTDRYRNVDKMDPKRRSMFNLIEDEHRKNSNEIAREIKRRSYLEQTNYEDELYKERERERTYHELPESDRYPTIDRDYNYNKSSHELDKAQDMKYDSRFVKNPKTKNGAGYRHSYAEPKLRMEKKNGYSDMIHRTNSSVGSNGNGRVGIASIHPY